MKQKKLLLFVALLCGLAVASARDADAKIKVGVTNSAYTSIAQDNRFADGSVNSYFGSLYGAYFSDRFSLDGVLKDGMVRAQADVDAAAAHFRREDVDAAVAEVQQAVKASGGWLGG